MACTISRNVLLGVLDADDDRELDNGTIKASPELPKSAPQRDIGQVGSDCGLRKEFLAKIIVLETRERSRILSPSEHAQVSGGAADIPFAARTDRTRYRGSRKDRRNSVAACPVSMRWPRRRARTPPVRHRRRAA